MCSQSSSFSSLSGPRRVLARSNRGVPPFSYEAKQLLAAYSSPIKRARSKNKTHTADPMKHIQDDMQEANKENIDDQEDHDDATPGSTATPKTAVDARALSPSRSGGPNPSSDSGANLSSSALSSSSLSSPYSGPSSSRNGNESDDEVSDNSEEHNRKKRKIRTQESESQAKEKEVEVHRGLGLKTQEKTVKPSSQSSLHSFFTATSSSSSSLSSSSSSASRLMSADASPPSTRSSIANDPALLKIRDRLTRGLLRAIRKSGHGSAPSGKKPYAAYEEGITAETAVRLMAGYDAYKTSNNKKLMRWLLFDVSDILQLLGCPAIIDCVQYSGWTFCIDGEEPKVVAHAEFEALEVRLDKEQNLLTITSRTRLHSTGDDRSGLEHWPPSKHVFIPAKQK